MLKATEKKRGYKIKGAKSGGVMNSNSKKSTVAKSSGKSYNGNTDQYRVMWTIEEGVLTDRDVSIFYDLIGDKKRGLYFPTTFEGETIFEIDNKLIYADTDYFYPSISRVISINNLDTAETKQCIEVIINGEEYGIESSEYYSFVETVYGEGTISSTDFVDSKAYRREKNGRGKGSGSGTPNSRSGKNILKSKPDTGTTSTESDSVPLGRLEIVKWLFTNIDGEKVFALYSTVYPDNPTLIYESKGLQAIFEKDYLLDLLEDDKYGKSIDGEPSFVERLSQRNWVSNVNSGSHSVGSLGSGGSDSDVGILLRKSRRKPRPAFISSLEYIYGIQPKTGVLKSKPDTETTSEKVQSAPLGRLEIDVEAQAKLDEAVKKYGAMKKGVAPTRDVTLPKRTEDDRYVRQTTRTAIESDRISDEVARELVEAIANNDEWATSDKRKTA